MDLASVCPVCGFDVGPDDLYCADCGAHLPAAVEIARPSYAGPQRPTLLHVLPASRPVTAQRRSAGPLTYSTQPARLGVFGGSQSQWLASPGASPMASSGTPPARQQPPAEPDRGHGVVDLAAYQQMDRSGAEGRPMRDPVEPAHAAASAAAAFAASPVAATPGAMNSVASGPADVASAGVPSGPPIGRVWPLVMMTAGLVLLWTAFAIFVVLRPPQSQQPQQALTLPGGFPSAAAPSLGLAGTASGRPRSPAPSPSPTAQRPVTAELDKPVSFDADGDGQPDGVVTITDIRTTTRGLPPGTTRISVKVALSAKQPLTVNRADWIARGQAGRRYGPGTKAPSPALAEQTLKTGDKASGWLVFDVPTSVPQVFIDYRLANGTAVLTIPAYG